MLLGTPPHLFVPPGVASRSMPVVPTISSPMLTGMQNSPPDIRAQSQSDFRTPQVFHTPPGDGTPQMSPPLAVHQLPPGHIMLKQQQFETEINCLREALDNETKNTTALTESNKYLEAKMVDLRQKVSVLETENEHILRKHAEETGKMRMAMDHLLAQYMVGRDGRHMTLPAARSPQHVDEEQHVQMSGDANYRSLHAELIMKQEQIDALQAVQLSLTRALEEAHTNAALEKAAAQGYITGSESRHVVGSSPSANQAALEEAYTNYENFASFAKQFVPDRNADATRSMSEIHPVVSDFEEGAKVAEWKLDFTNSFYKNLLYKAGQRLSFEILIRVVQRWEIAKMCIIISRLRCNMVRDKSLKAQEEMSKLEDAELGSDPLVLEAQIQELEWRSTMDRDHIARTQIKLQMANLYANDMGIHFKVKGLRFMGRILHRWTIAAIRSLVHNWKAQIVLVYLFKKRDECDYDGAGVSSLASHYTVDPPPTLATRQQQQYDVDMFSSGRRHGGGGGGVSSHWSLPDQNQYTVAKLLRYPDPGTLPY